METEHKKTLQSILDWHKQEIERLKNEQNKTSALSDAAKYFCIEGEIYSLKSTFQKLLDFQESDAMAAHLAETIEDNIRQGCELANKEVEIAELKISNNNLEKLLREERAKYEKSESGRIAEQKCKLSLEQSLTKIKGFALEIAKESEF